MIEIVVREETMQKKAIRKEILKDWPQSDFRWLRSSFPTLEQVVSENLQAVMRA
jgi:hypothetical protein